MPDVVALGETMVLLVPTTSGPLRYANTFTRHIGGAESNLCIGLVRLGRSAGWISRVGDDEFGRYVVNTIRGEGVDTSRVRVDAEAPTGVFFKERRELGESRVYYYRRGSAASRMRPSDLDEAYIRSAKVLAVSGITPALSPSCRETVFAAMDIARAAGVLVAFDPNVRLKLWTADEARPVLADMARRSDWVLAGQDEAELITGEAEPERSAATFLAWGSRLAVIKLGAAGCLVAGGEAAEDAGGEADRGPQRVPGVTLPRVVDPIGAGDGFGAGFIAATLDGLPPVEAGRLANAVGAFATTVVGDIEGLPTRAELERFLGSRADVAR